MSSTTRNLTRLSALALALAVLGTACNPRYCEGNPGNNCLNEWDAGSDGVSRCTSNDQCAAPTPVCDVTGTETCVQCTPAEPAACTGTTPVCGSANTCEACTAHAQCGASNACLPDGACADTSQVAYVDPAGTDNDACTKTMPCTKVAKALATGRPYVKLRGTTNEQVSINNQNVTLLADPGAMLTSTTNGILLEIRGNSQVAVYDLTIDGASGATGYGISMPTGNTANVTLKRVTLSGNTGGGVSLSGGMLAIAQSTISGNAGGGVSAAGGTLGISQSTIAGNAGGGVSITSAEFTLTNNVIVGNGNASSFYGGVSLQMIPAGGTHKLDFNAIAHNTSATNSGAGISCSNVLGTKTFSNNIVYSNPQGATTNAQITGMNCGCTYCNVGPMAFPGTGNLAGDPMFVNPAQRDYHIAAGSPCKDAADPAATLSLDVDGDSRPQGSGRDIGADEIKL